MNRKNVKISFISVIVLVNVVGISSVFLTNSIIFIGFLPLVIFLLALFSFGPRYLFYFHGMSDDNMFEVHERITCFINRYKISNILHVYIEEFKFNAVWGGFLGTLFLASLYDPRHEDTVASAALKDILPLTITIIFMTMIIFHGIIIHLLCWVTSILLKLQITKETRYGKQLVEKIKQTTLTSNSLIIDISLEVERIVRIGIPNKDIETDLIPFLLEKSSQSKENEKAQFIIALRVLAEHGYWKWIYGMEPLNIIIDGYASKEMDVRCEAEGLPLYDSA